MLRMIRNIFLPEEAGLQIPSVVDPYIIGMRTGMSRLPILVGKWEDG